MGEEEEETRRLAWKEEERRIEAGEGGSRELVSKNNFTGFLQPCIPQRSHGSAAEQSR